MMATRHEIDYIEYHGPEERPASVITDGGSSWDFEWSEIEQTLYYHQSGSGPVETVDLPLFRPIPDPPVKIYIRPGLHVRCYRPDRLMLLRVLATLARALPVLWRIYRRLADHRSLHREATSADFPRLGLVRLDAPLGDPFEDAIEGKVVYCRFCDDSLPEDHDEICSHLWYGPDGLDGPGSDEADPAMAKAFVVWLDEAGESVSAYDFDDWKKGAWAAWRHLLDSSR